MVNFIAANESEILVYGIDIVYASQQSLDDQSAPAEQVTVLSDGAIPSGTEVTGVSVNGTEIPAEGTQVTLEGGTVFVTPIFYHNPKSGQDAIIGLEIQNNAEG
ncbi:MAG TPA: hypothetical protein VK004_04645 [Ignavibacteria bacterium]|nr:hypothetical protein [Ignavibacteria bacterium]